MELYGGLALDKQHYFDVALSEVALQNDTVRLLYLTCRHVGVTKLRVRVIENDQRIEILRPERRINTLTTARSKASA